MKKILLPVLLALGLAASVPAQPMPVIYAATNFTVSAFTNGVTIQPWPASGAITIKALSGREMFSRNIGPDSFEKDPPNKAKFKNHNDFCFWE